MPTTAHTSEWYQQIMRIIGFAFFIEANSFVLREPGLLFIGDIAASATFLRNSSLLPFALSLLVLGLLSFFTKILTRKRLMALIIVSFLSGITLLLLYKLIPAKSDMLIALILIIFSLYSSFVFMDWADIVSRINTKEAWILILSSAALSSALFLLCAMISNVVSATFVFCVLSVVALLLLMVSHNDRGLQTLERRETDSGDMKAFKRLWKKEGLPVFSLGSLAFISAISRLLIDNAPVIYPNGIEMAATILAAGILYLLMFRFSVVLNLEKVFMFAFPIVALALLLLPLSGSWAEYLFFGLSKMVFTLGLMLLMLVCKKLSDDLSLPAVGAYGIFSGTVHLMMLLGYYIPFVKNGGPLDSFDYSLIALICIYGLSLLLLAGRMQVNRQGSLQNKGSDSLDATCELIKLKQGLTAQETEVLKMLAHGRSIPYISEQMYISQNTVRTHTKHIYKKLDVHSREECIDLVVDYNGEDLENISS